MQPQPHSTPSQAGAPPMSRPQTNMATHQAGTIPTSQSPASQVPPSSRGGPSSGPMMPPQPQSSFGAPSTNMGMRQLPMGFGAPSPGMPQSNIGAPPLSMGMSQPSGTVPGSQHYSQPGMGGFPATQVSGTMLAASMAAGAQSSEQMPGQSDSFVGQAMTQSSLPVGGVTAPMSTLATGASHGGIHRGRRAYPGHVPPSPVQSMPSPGQVDAAGTGMGIPTQQPVSTAVRKRGTLLKIVIFFDHYNFSFNNTKYKTMDDLILLTVKSCVHACTVLPLCLI